MYLKKIVRNSLLITQFVWYINYLLRYLRLINSNNYTMKTKFKGILTLLLAFTVHLVFAQKTVTGTVSDESGPLPGVSVLIKGTTTGTETDFDGKYSLQANQGDVLLFSYVGIPNVEKTVGASNVIDVVMTGGEVLEEVVITALGIPRKEKSLGYEVQEVKGDDISKAKETNLVNSLTGKVAGVQITNSSGSVGSSSRIVLRGASSIFGDNQPLFVVDGVPVSNANMGSASSGAGFDVPNAVADLNPDDIESMDVLKGPGATALYGIRAANGVIIIKTKRGKKSEKLGIDISSSIALSNPLVLPSFQNSYGQGNDPYYFEYQNGSSGHQDGVDESWGPPLDVGLEFMQFTSFINNPDNPQPEPWISHPDNVKNFYDTGLKLENNVTLSGGDEKNTFRLGLGYFDEAGIVPFTDLEKFSFNANGSRNFSDRVSANFGIKYIKNTSENLPTSGYDGGNVVQQMIWAARQVDFEALRNYENLPSALPGSVYGEGIVPINWNTQFQNNPYWHLATNTNSFRRHRVIGNMGITYKFLNNFTLTGNVGLDFYDALTSVKFAKGTAADAPAYWRFGAAYVRNGSDGWFDEDARSFYETNASLLLNYTKDLTKDFDLSLNFGGNMMYNKYRFNYNAVQLELPGLYSFSNALAGTTITNVSSHSQQAINSLYGTGELSFKDMLFLNVTARNDWASVLPTQNNSFFYPSVSLSAVLTEALGIKSDNLNYLKLRGNWAKVGGFGPLAPSDIINTYNLSGSPWNGIAFGSTATTLNNPDIKSQTTEGYEVGIEARMFKNRLRFNVTGYDQRSYNLVIPAQVTTSSGYSRVWDNLGELNNKGIEVQLGTTILNNEEKDYSIDLDVNWGKNNNEVISAGPSEEDDTETIILGGQWNMNLEAREGYPYGVIVGPSLERDDNGSVVYNNGLPVIGDNIVLGDIQPDWTGGVNLNIRFKGITLGGLVDAKIGGEVYSMTNAWGRFAGILAETIDGREGGIVGNGVMLEDGEYVTNTVVVSAESFNKNTFGNDIVETSVFDASYIKLRQLSLGYELPSKFVKPLGIDNINLSLLGRNLAILYKEAPHIDPETGFSNRNGDQGQEFGQLPSTRSYTFKIDISL